MPTLILSPRFSSDTQALWQACIHAKGWNTHRAYRYQIPEDIKNPTVYGEMQFCDIVASRIGLHLLEPPNGFLQDLCQMYGGERFTCRKISLIAHKELKHIKERRFIKPANDKVFVAGIYERGEDVPHKYIDPECPVIVSDVVKFDLEYRCYVLDGKVQTLSCYEWPGMVHQENPNEADDARSFARNLLDFYPVRLPSAFVLDVGKLEDGRWAVIEANQAYASGIYHEADVSKVLPIIARAASHEVSEADQVFIRDL